MRKLVGIVLILLGGCMVVEAQSLAGWQLTFADEFSGDSGSYPDASKWNIEVTDQPYNDEAQAYLKNARNVSLNGSGHLVLTAFEEKSGRQAYTSARMNTQGRFAQTYGRWEARMQLPAGTGMWPAFWMLGTEKNCTGWPDCGEIDIMENRGRLGRVASSALHGPGYSGNTPIVHSFELSQTSPNFFEAFHVFACEWDAQSIRFFVDTNLHYTVNKTDVENYGKWVYDHDFYMVLNLAIGGVYDGMLLPPSSAFPAQLKVDYVRVYMPVTEVNFVLPRSAISTLSSGFKGQRSRPLPPKFLYQAWDANGRFSDHTFP